MNCDEVKMLMDAFGDGELDLVNTVEIEKHIETCGGCGAMHRKRLALSASLGDRSFYYRAPASLERAVRAKIAEAGGPARRIGNWGRWMALAAAVVLMAGLGWIAMMGRGGGGAENPLAAEIVSAHVRSLMADHLWDVKSSDQHTVKPWFDGKLDFAPEVRDFKGDGFALEGGRLDYVGDRGVAALVYRSDKHYINLFIWPAGGEGDGGAVVSHRQGYVMVRWVRGGMVYWAVSDKGEAGMRRFAGVVGK